MLSSPQSGVDELRELCVPLAALADDFGDEIVADAAHGNDYIADGISFMRYALFGVQGSEVRGSCAARGATGG